MWIFNFIGLAKPNVDDTLHGLLDLKPWDDAERQRYDDVAVLHRIRRNPGGVAVRYEFRRHPFKKHAMASLYPAFRIVSLGGSLRTIRACKRAYPAAFAVRNPAPGPKNAHHNLGPPTLLHAACMFKAGVAIVEYLHR